MQEEYLRSYLSFFDKLSQEDRDALCYASFPQKYCKDEIIVDTENGESCTSLIVVTSGRLKCFQTNNKKRLIALYNLFKGDFCVLSAAQALYNININMLISVDSEDAEIIKIPIHAFLPIRKRYPDIALFIRQQFTDRFTDILFVLGEKNFLPTKSAIAGFLAEIYSYQEGEELKITQEDISNDLAISRSHVSSILNELESDGILYLSRGTIKVLDEKKLLEYL